jgi:hypothetical protein
MPEEVTGMPFDNLNEACHALLLSAAGILNKTGLRYVVAGGWVPLLIEPNHSDLVHPGTRDVDVLMIDELDAVQAATRALLDNRFRPSAKHEFQLLRDAAVGAREFVFNIDLMHPYEADATPQMFSDIFDLGVDDAYDPRGTRFAKSIAFRSAEIVYEEDLFSTVTVEGVDLDGERVKHDVPILSATAFILSKCESVSTAKRTRDAFDIYYMISSVSGSQHAEELCSLAKRFPQVDGQVGRLRCFLRDSPDQFNRNVSLHAQRYIENAARDCLVALTQ